MRGYSLFTLDIVGEAGNWGYSKVGTFMTVLRNN